MEFLNIPVEVVDKSILPYLGWNDLLRFRRVCKATKSVVNGYIKVNPELVPEIDINEDEKSFGAFLEMNLPTTKIFLNNVSPQQELYEKDKRDMALFLQRFGKLIKHLRVHQLSYHIYGKEWDFLEALVNLESLEADHYGYGEATVESLEELADAEERMILEARKDVRFLTNDPPVPHAVFKHLKVFKIGQEKHAPIKNVNSRWGGFLQFCKGLEYAALPFNQYFPFKVPEEYSADICFYFMKSGVEGNPGFPYPLAPNLKTLDFVHFHEEVEKKLAFEMAVNASEKFLQLCRACLKRNVMLKNVNPFWFIKRPDFFGGELASRDLGIPVLSIVNLHSAMYSLYMPNLEKVEVHSTKKSNVEGVGFDWRVERPDWPNLKYLDILVDNRENLATEWRDGVEGSSHTWTTKNIFNFFFQDVSRTNLVELVLKFKEDANFAVPKTEDIVTSCPNLKKLKIINWRGTNKALMKLFDGLKGLEEIELESCKDLGNVAFVGLDTRNPVIFKLKKLRKLSLKGLDKMPKITDLLFSMVIRHLKLTHLTLTSDSPIKSVTSAGILSLLEGGFAESIEKFSFQDWSLTNVSVEDFKKMEKKFRSHFMI